MIVESQRPTFSSYFYIRQNHWGIWRCRKSQILLHASEQKCAFQPQCILRQKLARPHNFPALSRRLSPCLYCSFLSVHVSSSVLLPSLPPPLLCFVLGLAAVQAYLAQTHISQLWVLAGQALVPEHRPTGWPHIFSQDSVFPSLHCMLLFCQGLARQRRMQQGYV